MAVRIEVLKNDRLPPLLPALARLRIEVFRDYPYLYDGTLEYEQRYLRKFAQAEGAVMIAAIDDQEVVGVATGAPLATEHPEFIQPFQLQGFKPSKVFYFAESVLLKSYRGRGIGHEFFNWREAHARVIGGFDITAFCAVVREDGHPSRPENYRSLEPFWRSRGYAPVPGLTTEFCWRDLGNPSESAKLMQFWTMRLGAKSTAPEP